MSGVITQDQIIPMLLEADPTVLSEWQWEQATFGDESDDLSYRVSSFLWVFEAHIQRCLREQRTERFPAIFRAIERLLADGGDDINYHLVIGFFEDLQHNADADATFDCDALLQFFGPESRRQWNWAAAVTGWQPSTNRSEEPKRGRKRGRTNKPA